MTDADASEATIQLMYKSYYAEMGGAGTPPEIPPRRRACHRHRQRHRVPPAAPKAEGRGIGPDDKTAATGGADLYVPRRGLCRHPVLLAVM